MPKISQKKLSWKTHKAKWSDCTLCDLSECRKKVVLRRGKIPCDILMVGEAPGTSEDALGESFIGPAGHLLDQIIARSFPLGVRVAFTTLVACIPKDAKGNKVKEPPKKAIQACADRLKNFIRLCNPKAVVAVGKLPSKYLPELLNEETELIEIPHPAYILRADTYQRTLALKKCEVILRDLVSLEKFHLDN